ncbi:MAG: hypothetical protein ACKOA7_03850 [Bacteroidota bacterium]
MKIFFAFALMWVLMGCSLYTADRGIPSYIYIPRFNLTTTYAEHGSGSSNIKDVWVFIDGDLQGVYPLPAHFPILREGPIDLQLSAGVVLNGISATRSIYPFYTQANASAELNAGQTDTILPGVTYRTSTQFTWMEDFEGQGFSLRTSPSSDTNIGRADNPAEVFEGARSMYIAVDSRAPYFQAEGIQTFSPPGVGLFPVFLELNYRNTQAFEIGLQIIGPAGSITDLPIVVFAPSPNEWKKQYVNFSPFLQRTPGYTYRVLVTARHEASLGQTGTIWLDNLKLLW